MAWYLNSFGCQLWLTREQFQLIEDRGDAHLFQPRTHVTKGEGPENCIAIFFESPNGSNGIGDYIHAMPALSAKVAAGYEVHVWTGEFFRPFIERAGCIWHPADTLGLWTIQEIRGDFGSIHSLVHWCIEHDEATFGDVHTPRFEQIAAYIGATLPDRYSWREAFDLPTNQLVSPDAPIVVALQSTSRERTYGDSTRPIPETRQLIEYITSRECIAFGGGNAHKEPWMHTAKDAVDLVTQIAGAAMVIGVDNGITAIALALGVPVLAVFGPTDEQTIVWQFARYVDCSNVRVMRSSPDGGCMRPCSLQTERGYGKDRKCMVDRSLMVDCYKDIEQHAVAMQAADLLHSLT